MEHIMNENHLRRLETLAGKKTLYGFDFDGTLAPISLSPETVKMREETISLVEELNQLVPVAVITGRSISDLRQHLPFSPRYLIGNHGIENGENTHELQSFSTAIDQFHKELLSAFGQELQWLGISIENKRYSLSLHYRLSALAAEAQVWLHKLSQTYPGFFFLPGKMVMNILPHAKMNKGIAFNQLLQKENCDCGFYIGDDETDEDVFTQNRGPDIVGVRIGVDIRSGASYFLKDQAEVDVLLTRMLEGLKKMKVCVF